MPLKRNDCDVGGAAADVDDHVAAGSVMGRPAPIAATMACSTRYTSLALARYAESMTARFSTCVISDGTPMTMRGCTSILRLCAFWMK